MMRRLEGEQALATLRNFLAGAVRLYGVVCLEEVQDLLEAYDYGPASPERILRMADRLEEEGLLEVSENARGRHVFFHPVMADAPEPMLEACLKEALERPLALWHKSEFLSLALSDWYEAVPAAWELLKCLEGCGFLPEQAMAAVQFALFSFSVALEPPVLLVQQLAQDPEWLDLSACTSREREAVREQLVKVALSVPCWYCRGASLADSFHLENDSLQEVLDAGMQATPGLAEVMDLHMPGYEEMGLEERVFLLRWLEALSAAEEEPVPDLFA